MTKPKSSSYQVKPNAALFIDKAGVLGSLGKAVIIDVREPDFYQGTKKMDFVAKAGRIKGAVNLPTTQVFTPSGTFKSKTELETLAKGVAGTDMNRPIVVYCDTGKVCTAWAFILTEVLGYANVKIYDGSTEEWMKDQAAPVEP
jgi:thiosulfate/3-mercaptopyruvate sulfurtransferase